MHVSNVKLCVMLLIIAAFCYTSCTEFRKAEDPYSSRNSKTSKKAPHYSGNESMLRRNITKYAQNYKGVRYKYAGKDPKGFDCSGFTSYVMNKFAVSLSPSSSAQSAQGKRISVRQAKPGDLVFFSKTGRGRPSHVALVVDNDTDGLVVIHSTTSRGVIEENVSRSSYWKPKMLFARDVIEK